MANPEMTARFTSNKKMQLEAMSREDLIQNSLKQTVLLQKLKVRYDEVQESLASIKKQKESEVEELHDELAHTKQFSKDWQMQHVSLKDEFACAIEKIKLLESSLHSLQQERDDLIIENKKFKNSSRVIMELNNSENEKLVIQSELRERAEQLEDQEESFRINLRYAQEFVEDNKISRNQNSTLDVTTATLNQAGSIPWFDKCEVNVNKMKIVIDNLKKRLKSQLHIYEKLTMELGILNVKECFSKTDTDSEKAQWDNAFCWESKLTTQFDMNLCDFAQSYAYFKSEVQTSLSEMEDLGAYIDCFIICENPGTGLSHESIDSNRNMLEEENVASTPFQDLTTLFSNLRKVTNIIKEKKIQLKEKQKIHDQNIGLSSSIKIAELQSQITILKDSCHKMAEDNLTLESEFCKLRDDRYAAQARSFDLYCVLLKLLGEIDNINEYLSANGVILKKYSEEMKSIGEFNLIDSLQLKSFENFFDMYLEWDAMKVGNSALQSSQCINVKLEKEPGNSNQEIYQWCGGVSDEFTQNSSELVDYTNRKYQELRILREYIIYLQKKIAEYESRLANDLEGNNSLKNEQLKEIHSNLNQDFMSFGLQNDRKCPDDKSDVETVEIGNEDVIQEWKKKATWLESESRELQEEVKLLNQPWKKSKEVQAQLNETTGCEQSRNNSLSTPKPNTTEENLLRKSPGNYCLSEGSLEANELRLKLNDRQVKLSLSEEKCIMLEREIKTLTTEVRELKAEVENLSNDKNNSVTFAVQKALKEKDEFCAKLKMVAVKAKKEVEISKKKVKSLEEELIASHTEVQSLTAKLLESQTRIANGQMMQKECDKLQDWLDQLNNEKHILQNRLDDVETQLEDSHVKKYHLEEELELYKVKCNKVTEQYDDVFQLFAATKATVERLETERNEQIDKIENMQQAEIILKEELSSLQKEANKLKISFADSQRHLSEAEKLSIETQERTTQLNEQVNLFKEEISLLKTDNQNLNSKLQDILSELQKHQQISENLKLELSSSSSEVRKLQNKILKSESDYTASVGILQRKIKALETNCKLLGREKDSLEAEFEKYKIRVHSVLKQQQTKNEDQRKFSDDELKILRLISDNDHLKKSLIDEKKKMEVQENELQLLHADYRRLRKQHEHDVKQHAELDSAWKTRVQDLQLELSLLQKQSSEIALQNNENNQALISSHHIELKDLKENNLKAITDLQRLLREAENEISAFHTQKEPSITNIKFSDKAASASDKMINHNSSGFTKSEKVLEEQFHRDDRHCYPYGSLNFPSTTREDAEGEENPESPPTFEHLLSTRDQVQMATAESESSFMSNDRQDLEMKCVTQKKKIAHLAEVVRENESTVSRLMDQNRILKEEIRRLENNQKRETSVGNMEYLKNVLYKFLTLPPCDEKKQLLPVMDTMLKFHPSEKTILLNLATGDAEEHGRSRWSGYFQRWSGLQ